MPIDMDFLSTKEFAEAHGLSERTVRNYCAQGKIQGARLTGKTWQLPSDAEIPQRKSKPQRISPLLKTLLEQKEHRIKGGIYHRTQIDFTYNSNHIEGSRLTQDQTRYIFETNTIGIADEAVKVDDIIETSNHFRCIDFIIENALAPLTERMIKQLHGLLKNATSEASLSWFAVGDYKRLPNEVGGIETTPPEEVGKAIQELLKDYKAIPKIQLEDLLDFHHRFERIHPFQDGNGRIGRLILFKECLRHGIVPFIITDNLNLFYYRGLQNWPDIKGYLKDTCLTAQDHYKQLLDYFRIKY